MDNKIDNSRALKFFEKWQNELSVAINPLRKPSENTTTHDSLIALVPPTAKKILEVGAGNGYIVNTLKKMGRDAVGQEISKKCCEAYGLVHCDMHDLIWDNNTFDVVIAKGCLEHTLSPRMAVREIWRVLRPNGILIADTPQSNTTAPWANRAHFISLVPDQWNNLLKMNGFHVNTNYFVGSYNRIIAHKHERMYG